MALHGGVIRYGATFLVFSDYMRPPMRLAALNGLPVITLFTHDSLAMGEDGPTHPPIEQLAGLRSIPGMVVIRPADANETVAAWRIAIEHRNDSVSPFSRRERPQTGGSVEPATIAEFVAQPHIDDALVGGAGLNRGLYAALLANAADATRNRASA